MPNVKTSKPLTKNVYVKLARLHLRKERHWKQKCETVGVVTEQVWVDLLQNKKLTIPTNV